MTSRSATLALTVLLAAPPGSAAQTPEPGDRSPPELTYLANEGVLLRGRGGLVLIDALFGDGLPEYQTVPRPLRDSLEAGAGLRGPALVLVTHAHRDHFDSAAVGRYLRANPAARSFGPPGTDTSGVLDLGWVHVTALPFPHGRTVRPVGHAAYLVTLDGITALHIGDTSSEPDTWPALGLPPRALDLALVPFWYATDERRLEALLRVTRARAVVLLHQPLGAGDRLEELEDDPRMFLPSSPGQMVRYARDR